MFITREIKRWPIMMPGTLGMVREDLSPCHSITIGFDLKPVGRASFDFPALTYYPERASDRMAYLTLFPVGSVMRANFMVYRDLHDPWLRKIREAPEERRLIQPRCDRPAVTPR